MAFAGRAGVELKLPSSAGSVLEQLFSEAPGLVYEVRRADLAAVQRTFEAEGVQVEEIGQTRKDLQAAPRLLEVVFRRVSRWFVEV